MSIQALIEGCVNNEASLAGLIFCDEEGECVASARTGFDETVFPDDEALAIFGASLGPAVHQFGTAMSARLSQIHFERHMIWLYRMRGNYYLAALVLQDSICRDLDQVLRFIADNLEREIP